jgi:hypothetical protein
MASVDTVVARSLGIGSLGAVSSDEGTLEQHLAVHRAAQRRVVGVVSWTYGILLVAVMSLIWLYRSNLNVLAGSLGALVAAVLGITVSLRRLWRDIAITEAYLIVVSGLPEGDRINAVKIMFQGWGRRG